MSHIFARDRSLRIRVAGSSPKTLVRQREFHFRQPGWWTISISSLAALYVLAPYTHHGAAGWDIFTVFVQLLAFWGALITINALAVMEVEMAIVREVEERGAEYLVDIKSKRIDRIDLDQLEQTMIPNNPSIPAPAMVRLFQHICKEAKDRKFDSSVNVMQPYREEPIDVIFKLQNLQKIALWLGILGTFVGLLIALQSGDPSKLQGGEPSVLMNVISKMFGGLSISFSASLAGLEVAVILGFFLMLLRKRQEAYYKEMEGAVITMLSLARNSINRDDFLVELGQVSSVVSGLSGRVYEQTQSLSERLGSVQEKIQHQTETIGTGIEKLASAQKEFDGFLQKLSESQKQFLDEIQSVYDALSPKNIGRSLEASVMQAGEQISTTIGPPVVEIASRLGELDRAIVTLRDALERQTGGVSESVRGFAGQIGAASSESTSALKALAQQLQDATTASDASSQAAMNRQLEGISRRLVDVINAIEKKGAAPELSRWRRFSELMRWGKW